MLPDQLSDEERNRIIQIITTEHFTLQTARAESTSETNGRLSVFLASVSSAMIALAFIGQVSEIGATFYVFALLLFPTLFFLGLVSFARVAQVSAWDFVYFRGIARIRHLYVELAPQLESYFVLPARDDDYGPQMMPGPTWVQFLLTAAGLIAVIDSVILAVLVGLIVSMFVADSLFLSGVAGVVAFILSLALHMRAMYSTFKAAAASTPSLFPVNAANREEGRREER